MPEPITFASPVRLVIKTLPPVITDAVCVVEAPLLLP